MAFGLDDAIAAGLKILDKFIADPDARAKAEAEFRDSLLTSVIDDTLVKVVSWYDNEWGYSNRVVDVVQRLL